MTLTCKHHSAGAVPVASRRDTLRLLGAVAAGGVLGTLRVTPLAATPAEMKTAIEKITGGKAATAGRVKLEIPPLVENGNTVPVTVTVDSPMTPADHVRAIHIVTEKNPQPNVIGCRLGPRAGRAMVSTRCRLADTQAVIALAEMSDGSFWTESVSVIITLGACLEDLI
jgi:sulfur-oxidizing protein SoxY